MSLKSSDTTASGPLVQEVGSVPLNTRRTEDEVGPWLSRRVPKLFLPRVVLNPRFGFVHTTWQMEPTCFLCSNTFQRILFCPVVTGALQLLTTKVGNKWDHGFLQRCYTLHPIEMTVYSLGAFLACVRKGNWCSHSFLMNRCSVLRTPRGEI